MLIQQFMDCGNSRDELNDGRIQYGSQDESICSDFRLSLLRSRDSLSRRFQSEHSQISSIRMQNSFYENSSAFKTVNQFQSEFKQQFYQSLCHLLDVDGSQANSFKSMRQYEQYQSMPTKRLKKITQGKSSSSEMHQKQHNIFHSERKFQNDKRDRRNRLECDSRQYRKQMSLQYPHSHSIKLQSCNRRCCQKSRSQFHSALMNSSCSNNSNKDRIRNNNPNQKQMLVNLGKKVDKMTIQCRWEGGCNVEYTPISVIIRK